ncbi:beta-lactamase family protein [Sphingomonas piscis]|uniref:Beta-lactamase family protein n=1 Tax=Sphingomonas piscis TaxID=2714943 RepID=A0A6G7YQR4_9SPHN|nr:serine hydrolase domain-containing protein [Sphingomonas piscis]QIK79076.1 beta-lactamase family protein [Sphingomonas piscis]
MKRGHTIGLGAVALAVAGTVVAMKSEPAAKADHPVQLSQAKVELAKVDSGARQRLNYQALDSRFKQLMSEPSMVGMAVGVVENGRITFLSGYGETLAKSGEQVTPETVFRWASVSKGVAATMVAKLAEQGKVSFSAPVANYSATLKLPGGTERYATVGDLMSHRLGLYRNAYDNKLEEGQDPRFLRQTLAQLNSICPPGTCWSYQNVAYDASTEIVERLTGKSYGDALREQLFGPIGMTSASVTRDGIVSAKSWARPHAAGRRPVDLLDTYYKVPAAGGVNSNIKDMSLWMIAQMGLMPDVVSTQVLNTIHAPLVKTPGERGRLRKFLERLGEADYGYGWRSYDYAGHRIVGHRGGVSGYRSLILFDPLLKSGVVALWNSNTSQPGGLEFEVMDMLYGLPFRDWLELDTAAPVTPAPEEEGAPQGTAAIAEAPRGRRAA